jgi:hypothetical protein
MWEPVGSAFERGETHEAMRIFTQWARRPGDF